MPTELPRLRVLQDHISFLVFCSKLNTGLAMPPCKKRSLKLATEAAASISSTTNSRTCCLQAACDLFWMLRHLHWWGTKCSSFVRMCTSASLRAESNDWEGDWANRELVYEGSCQGLVTSLGIFIGIVLSCLPILEQPTSSTMPLQPCMRSGFGYIFWLVKVLLASASVSISLALLVPLTHPGHIQICLCP